MAPHAPRNDTPRTYGARGSTVVERAVAAGAFGNRWRPFGPSGVGRDGPPCGSVPAHRHVPVGGGASPPRPRGGGYSERTVACPRGWWPEAAAGDAAQARGAHTGHLQDAAQEPPAERGAAHQPSLAANPCPWFATPVCAGSPPRNVYARSGRQGSTGQLVVTVRALAAVSSVRLGFMPTSYAPWTRMRPARIGGVRTRDTFGHPPGAGGWGWGDPPCRADGDGV